MKEEKSGIESGQVGKGMGIVVCPLLFAASAGSPTGRAHSWWGTKRAPAGFQATYRGEPHVSANAEGRERSSRLVFDAWGE